MANLILNKKGNTINLTDSTDNKVKAFALYGKATQKQYTGKNKLNPIKGTGWSGIATINENDIITISYDNTSSDSTKWISCPYGLSYNFKPNHEYKIVIDIMEITGNAFYAFINSPQLTPKGIFDNNGVSLPSRASAGKFIEVLSSVSDFADCTVIARSYAGIPGGKNGSIKFRVSIYDSDEIAGLTYEEIKNFPYEPYVGGIISPNPDYPQEIEVSGASGSVEVTTSNEENTKSTTATISTPNGLPGIPVASGGNYVDENGQQWVCDEIVKYADGSGKKIQRIGKSIFDGSESWTLDAETNFNENTFTAYCSNLPPIAFYGRWVPIPSLCNRLVKSETQVWDNKITNECFMVCKHSEESANEAGQITIRLNKDRVSTISSSALKAFLSANPLEVYYELSEPIITELSAEEIAEIEKLQTFYPVTNISNDADCGMEISYVSTKQNMQVKALLSGVETTFTDLGNNVFEAVLTAPNHDGLYEIEINAVSQTGDTASATVDLTVASWVTPKVNWLPTDRLNIQDFNRIRNNMISLWELLQWEFGHFAIEDMGDELTEYTGRWNVNHFNAFEKNLEIFRTLLPIDDFGLTQTFYYNGMLIKYDELNRIENLLLRFKQYATSREAGIRKLPFRLGAFREVRI